MCLKCWILRFLYLIFASIKTSSQEDFKLLPLILYQDSGNSKGNVLLYGGSNNSALREYLNELGYPVITAFGVNDNLHAFDNKYVLIYDFQFYHSSLIGKMIRNFAKIRNLHNTVNSYIYILPKEHIKMIEKAYDTTQFMTHIIVSDDTNPKVETVCPGCSISQRKVRPTCGNPLVGKSLNVSAFGTAPFVDRLKLPLKGSDIDVIKLIAKKVGFKVNLKLAHSWNDAVRTVMNGSCSIGVGNFDSSFRRDIIDFIWPSYSMGLSFGMSQPKILNQYFNIFRPFSGTVWLFVMVSSLSISLMFMTTMKLRHNKNRFNQQVNIVISTFAMQVGQCVTFNVSWRSLGHKFLIQSMVIYSAFLIMAFESNLRASLIKSDHEKPIDTLEELYESGKLLYFPRNSAQLQKFLLSSLDYMREIGEKSMKNNCYYNCFNYCEGGWMTYEIVSEGNAFVLPKEFLLANYQSVLNDFDGKNVFYLSKDPFTKIYSAIFTTKGAPWKHQLSQIIIGLTEGGIINKLIYKYISPTHIMIHNTPPDDEWVPWDLTPFSGAFLILFMMLFASNLLFILEANIFTCLIFNNLHDEFFTKRVLFKHKNNFSNTIDMHDIG